MSASFNSMILPPSHWVFQLGNVFFLLSYLSINMLFLRSTLALASLCLVIWASALNSGGWIMDAFVWNTIFLIINVAQIGKILYDRRRIKFHSAIQEIYDKTFSPFFTPAEFEGLLGNLNTATGAKVVSLEPNEIYAQEGEIATRLSFLLSGSMHVSTVKPSVTSATIRTTAVSPSRFYNAKLYNYQYHIPPLSSVDSPHWLSRGSLSDRIFEVVLAAGEEKCQLLSWSYASLSSMLKQRPDLAGRFDSLLGLDVAKKLYRSNEANSWRSFSVEEKEMFKL